MRKQLVSWGAFLIVVSAVAVGAGPTALGGPASYVIVDGRSMNPTYQNGDLVVAYESAAYERDDVIVYDAPVDSQFNVIHRIVERTDGGFITQGDNRDEPDGWVAPDEAIYGKAVFHIPRGGTIVSFLRQPAAIFAFLAGWLTLAILDRRRPSDGDDVDQTEGEVEEVPNNPNLFVSTQLAPVSSLATEQQQKIKEPVSKKTIAIFGIAALIGGSAGIMVANAASLRVDAGVLQAFTITDLPEPPTPPEAATSVNLQVHFFSGGQGRNPGTELGAGASPVLFDPIVVPAGHTYDVQWDGPGNSNVVDCFDGETITFRDEVPPTMTPQGVSGPFDPFGEGDLITHLLCVQTASGNILNNLTFTTIDEKGNSTNVEFGATSFIDETCEGEDEEGCVERGEEFEQETLETETPSNGDTSRERNGDREEQHDDTGMTDRPVDRDNEGSKDVADDDDHDLDADPADPGASSDADLDKIHGSDQGHTDEGGEERRGEAPANGTTDEDEKTQEDGIGTSNEEDETDETDETGNDS